MSGFNSLLFETGGITGLSEIAPFDDAGSTDILPERSLFVRNKENLDEDEHQHEHIIILPTAVKNRIVVVM